MCSPAPHIITNRGNSITHTCVCRQLFTAAVHRNVESVLSLCIPSGVWHTHCTPFSGSMQCFYPILAVRSQHQYLRILIITASSKEYKQTKTTLLNQHIQLGTQITTAHNHSIPEKAMEYNKLLEYII